ncbi:PREDICTED: threonine dehydratase biosynthetic, chloroplastic-like [Camelina sativa]|uniref:Threonine dehydratase biosynthetic, chloroplastic-like n=1 Tax=Camelina sativa TaxID=90675 RepID=A0ABM0VRJ5_CAMSA|nr:PREDICTED: threonine dehydratase biosynthetic, chloroplastic-like [Camelina sativa]
MSSIFFFFFFSLSLSLSFSRIEVANRQRKKMHSMDMESVEVGVEGDGYGGDIIGGGDFANHWLGSASDEVSSNADEAKIIGVEPADANAMALSLNHDERVILDKVGDFADGVAVKEVGEETFRISRNLMDGVVLVTRESINVRYCP